MKAIRIVNLQINPNPVERNTKLKVQVQFTEYERGQYARQTGSTDIDLYAGESIGRA